MGRGGGIFWKLILMNQEGSGVIGQIPSTGKGGGVGYGYFLELHDATTI